MKVANFGKVAKGGKVGNLATLPKRRRMPITYSLEAFPELGRLPTLSPWQSSLFQMPRRVDYPVELFIFSPGDAIAKCARRLPSGRLF
jgi:hypothetical protein